MGAVCCGVCTGLAFAPLPHNMAENVQASDADDLEEGEIPSSEDEDESKDAETTNKLSEKDGEDDGDAAHEEPTETRKRQRDASSETSMVDACNSTPDHPKVRPSGEPSHHGTHSKPNLMLHVCHAI